MRLLLAEDEKELSHALVTVLLHNNYSVDAVYNGQDALDYINMGNYDGAILDIMMPKMDGITVLKKVRASGNQMGGFGGGPGDHQKPDDMTPPSDGQAPSDMTPLSDEQAPSDMTPPSDGQAPSDAATSSDDSSTT